MTSDIRQRFANSHIMAGGVLLVHSSISRTLRETTASPTDIIEALLAEVGPEGTLLFPLFNFDFTKCIPFDLKTTPSQMGALTEAARGWDGVVRTGHPVYSFACIGGRKAHFEGVCNRSAYGPDSPFAMLREMNGQIAVIDLPDQNAMTFYHHVEEALGVPYRFHKTFTSAYTDASEFKEERTFSIFVRDLERGVVTKVDRMGERLWDKGLYLGQRPGVGNGMRVIEARAMFDEVRSVIEEGRAKDFLYGIKNATH